MLFPIRCITCGKVINQFYKTYQHMITEENVTKKDALDKLKINRYCCRRMFLCHEEVFDYISEFDKANFSFIHDKIEDIKIVNDNQINNIDPDIDIVDMDVEVDLNIDLDIESVSNYDDNFDEMY